MKMCEGISLEVLGAGCRLNRGLVLEDGARRPPWLSGNLVGISINLCKSIQKELFINDTP